MMQRILVFFGVIFIGLLVIGGIGLGYSIYASNKLDAASKAYTTEVLPKILGDLTQETFMKFMSEEDKKQQPVSNTTESGGFFAKYRRLGSFKSITEPKGASWVSVTARGALTTAKYYVKADFEKGPADVTLFLVKRDKQWWVTGIDIEAEVLGDPVPTASTSVPISTSPALETAPSTSTAVP